MSRETWNSWSSWSSPVGLGIFFLTTALAAAIAIYALFNLIGSVLAIAHPQPSYQMQYQPTDTLPAGSAVSGSATQ